MHKDSWFLDLAARDDSIYSIRRDATNSVDVLRCARCGIIDITPFDSDIEYAKYIHEQFHRWVLAQMPAHPPKWPASLHEILEYGFAATLDGDDKIDNDFRMQRVGLWSPRETRGESARRVEEVAE